MKLFGVLALATVVLTGRKLLEQCWSISQVMVRGRSDTLPSVSTSFFTNCFKHSSSRSWYFSSTRIEGQSLSRKYLSIVGSPEAPAGSYFNKMDGKYSRWATQSKTDTTWYWESRPNLLQILFAKTWSSPRFVRRKLLNSAKVIGASFVEQRLYWCHCWATTPCKNKAAKGIQLALLGPTVSK